MIKDILTAGIEDTYDTDIVLEYFQRNDGKRITERDVQKLALKLAVTDLRLRKAYGMAHLEWGGYNQTGGNKGKSLLIAYAEKNITISASFLLEHNQMHYSAAQERNARRQAALANPAKLEALEALIAKHSAAYDAMKAIEKDIDAAMEEVGVDGYAIEKTIKGRYDARGQKIYR